MAKIVVMPKLGLTMKEGTIVKWVKKEGDTINAGEVLFEVSTDKLTNEIEANESGIVRKLLSKEGDSVECLKPVAIIADIDEDISSLLKECNIQETLEDTQMNIKKQPMSVKNENKSKNRIKISPAAKKLAIENNIDIEIIVGTGPEGRIVIKDIEKLIQSQKNKTKVSPVADKMSKEFNVDLSEINKDGRIMKEDILAFINKSIKDEEEFEEKRISMTQMRKVIASRMYESWSVAPVVNYNMRADITNLKKVKNALKDICKVTYTDLLVKIVSKALMQFPLVNCSVDGEELILRHYVNIGVAVAIDGGLVVPVIKHAQKKGLKEISQEVKNLASKAKDNQLNSDDMEGGTFTITNLGMFGMESFSPIINQPEVAILGVNKIEETPMIENGEVVSKPLMNLSLTADHRAVDGAVAAEFLAKVKELIEKPEILIL
ncbi:dihydrolipoamide acetyltransferase family protein [Anaerophilus nitritogenes]|uniref:dihydrolipoamide acetyltransferase family protein n=1 Tax=Anaerophilus nitritogenes TaxID=2498136 RepID=UPI00101D9BB1|nr:dihydrolipoamide acetyltransferase family protein [Anaerophilus nitritogenes]